jgi:diguanylate cyclase (GGDEF)-like protein
LRAHVAGDGGFFERECRMMHADGQPRWVSCRGRALRDDAGHPVRAAGSTTDITDRKLAEEQLRVVSLHDALTGLPNRTLLRERLERCATRARRSPDYRYAVLYLDLDRFKMINDSLGHAAGDRLLNLFGARVVQAVRALDTLARPVEEPLARLGGDEFVLLVEDLRDDSDALRIAERVLGAVREPFDVAGRAILVGCSVGIALGSTTGASADDLLRDADLALYHAKSKGRGRYELFDASIHAATLSRWQLEGELRDALGTGAFFVEYQPIVELATGRVVGLEALVRWNHPTRGRVPPLDFIAIAEDTGLVVPLGLEVLRTVADDLVAWRQANPAMRDIRVAVNVSARQVHAGGLTASFATILAAAGLSPSDIDVEITESVLMDATEAVLGELAALRAAGHRLHLDDFGTGYCSLSYLRRIRVDALKIDRSFVQAMLSDPTTKAIVRAILTIADSFGIDAIAEGLETRSERSQLDLLGCRLGQGFLFDRPLSSSAVVACVKGRRAAA